MLISVYENEILTDSVFIDFSILSVNCSHLCIIYVKIFDKNLSGGLEVSFSIDSNFIANNLRKQMGLRHFFHILCPAYFCILHNKNNTNKLPFK